MKISVRALRKKSAPTAARIALMRAACS